MATFHFYSPRALEPWDWRNPDSLGIGNSETSHIEMALRLAKRGHEVYSYTRLPDGAKQAPDSEHGGVRWMDLEQADFSTPGIWVLYRCPDIIDQFVRKGVDQSVWLVVQDTYFRLNDVQSDAVDRVVVLCASQAKAQAIAAPRSAEKIVVSSNGIRVDMIEEVERQSPGERNPHRLHFSSSPDRGLPVLLERILPRVREYVPDVELHVYYGWNNIQVLMSQGDEASQERAKRFFGPSVEKTQRLLGQYGVHWHGRIGQRDLTREWLKASVFAFPSLYPESSCASVMEAQALGAIPVVQSRWALAENTKWGTQICGDAYGDPLTIARYVAETARLLQMAPGILNPYRQQMMADARRRFDWENWAVQWEAWAAGRDLTREEAIRARQAETFQEA